MKLNPLYVSSLALGVSLYTSCSKASAQSSSPRKPADGVRVESKIDDDKKTTDDDDEASSRPTDDDDESKSRRDDDGDAAAEAKFGDGDCYKGTQEICGIEKEIFTIVNQERSRKGLSAFTYSGKVAYVARLWSDDQARRGRIGHDGWPNARERVYQQEFQTRLGTSAENVAMTSGADPAQVAKEFMRMWMGSPGHRANILGDSAGIGVGVAQTSDGEWYATQIFTFR